MVSLSVKKGSPIINNNYTKRNHIIINQGASNKDKLNLSLYDSHLTIFEKIQKKKKHPKVGKEPTHLKENQPK